MAGMPLAVFLLSVLTSVYAIICDQIRMDTDIKYLNWDRLEACIIEAGRNPVDKNSSGKLWRLIKNANDGLENLSPAVYTNMGNLLTVIPLEDLRNITFDVIETIRAFGSIQQGFSDEQWNLIAGKVRNEWPHKNPDTYSEYDLIAMGQVVCYLNSSDIVKIHTDAFRFAAEWIGNLENCPKDRIQAFAQLAVQDNAFGHPSNWSKLDVSVLGNIITGLTPSQIESIGREKLRLNKRFRKSRIYSNTTNTPSYNRN